MKWMIVKRDTDIFQVYYIDDSDKPTFPPECVIIEEGEDLEPEPVVDPTEEEI